MARIPSQTLLNDISRCTLCADHLPLGPRPVLQAASEASILVVGQAPGTAVHATGQPFNDPSGDRLRRWLGVSRERFYDAQQFALVPMGFCYPGKGRGGDLPPRPECAPQWRRAVLAQLPNIQLTVLVGRYALSAHIEGAQRQAVTNVVAAWRDHWPAIMPLPHPSPRNTRWLRDRPWVEADLIPVLQERVSAILAPT